MRTRGMLFVLSCCGGLALHADTLQVYPLQEVRVIANRVPTELAALPYAITLRSAPQWAIRRTYSVEELLQGIPGVFVQSRGGISDLRIVIRGFGARGAGDRSNNGTTRGVRILLDGIPLTEPDGRTALDLLEPLALQQAEIVRSNTSLLWGNASGGVLSFRTLPMELPDAAPIRATLAVGSFGYRRGALQVLPIPTLALTATYARSDGWRRHSEGERLWLGSSLQTALSPTLRAELALSATRNRFLIPGPLDWETFEQDPTAANATYAQQRARRENTLASISLTLLHTPAPTTQVNASAFVQPKFLVRSERGTYREFSRVQTGASVVAWHRASWGQLHPSVAVGADYVVQDGPALFYGLAPDGGRDSVLRANKREAAFNGGAFVRAALELEQRLWLWAGLRAEWLRYRLIDALAPSRSAVKDFQTWLPAVGINVRLSDAHSLYAHASSGWEVPAYNEVDPPPTNASAGLNPDLQPMSSWTWELGSRHLLRVAPLRLAMQLELALFHILVRNELVPYGGGRFYVNAAHSTRSGTEAALTVSTDWGAVLRLALTYGRYRYAHYRIDSSYFGRSGVVDYSGHAIAGVPELLGSAQLWLPLPTGLPLRWEVELQHTSSYYADDANTITVPVALLLSTAVRATEGLRLGDVGLLPWVELRNVLNRRHVGSVYINPDRDARGRPLFAEPGMPRALNLGLQLRY
jgi:iron complex outermembrane receptor protein